MISLQGPPRGEEPASREPCSDSGRQLSGTSVARGEAGEPEPETGGTLVGLGPSPASEILHAPAPKPSQQERRSVHGADHCTGLSQPLYGTVPANLHSHAMQYVVGSHFSDGDTEAQNLVPCPKSAQPSPADPKAVALNFGCTMESPQGSSRMLMPSSPHTQQLGCNRFRGRPGNPDFRKASQTTVMHSQGGEPPS